MGQDVVEVSIPQEPKVKKYYRGYTQNEIDDKEAKIVILQEEILKLKDIQKQFPKEIIKEIIK